ncbi:MAG: Fe-Mn family superoxide dismutase [bacterium]|nr:Fe-Mn family superoxide dismutase [bacterium]
MSTPKLFEELKFNISNLVGISDKTTEEHLKLYSGYVKNANLILQKIDELSIDSEKNAYVLGELQRRFGFEFDGMRNHEIYFSSLSRESVEEGRFLSGSSKLQGAISEEWNSFEKWLQRFKTVAMTRGVGWAILYYDKKTNRLLNSWVDEQHLGHLTGLTPILALDMWEHSYVADYLPSGKKKYIEDFFTNLNWQKIEENFSQAL